MIDHPLVLPDGVPAVALIAGEARAAKGELAAKVVQKPKPEAAKGKLKPATERRA